MYNFTEVLGLVDSGSPVPQLRLHHMCGPHKPPQTPTLAGKIR